MINRRRFLQASAAGLALSATSGLLPRRAFASAPSVELKAQPTMWKFMGEQGPETQVWSYNNVVPGSVIRLTQGNDISIYLNNLLPQATTVHWHGIRLPNAQDGVPHLTQDPTEAGKRYTYWFTCPDAGTFWYHPHHNSAEQVDRGLAGAFIVDEKEPIQVDRDILWVLDDWRLDDAGVIAPFDQDPTEKTHTGRLGNVFTINGKVGETLDVRAGERIRLRLLNIANARIFNLKFDGHRPYVIAYDGQPTTPHEPDGGGVVLAPAQRVDLIIDGEGKPGMSYAITDDYQNEFDPAKTRFQSAIRYSTEAPLRESPLDAKIQLPANPVPVPDLRDAPLMAVNFGGGHMEPHWTVNGLPGLNHDIPPLARLTKGRSYRFHWHNATDFPHPIHLHGFSFQVLSRNGQNLPRIDLRDTVLLKPQEMVEVAFVADAPGKWMLHCHILEHQMAGMMGVVEVA